MIEQGGLRRPSRRQMPRFAFVFVATLFGSACGPEAGDEIPKDAATRFAAAMCDAQERCDCLGEVFESRSQCDETAVALFEAVAQTADLSFSRSCFEDLILKAQESACVDGAPGLGLKCVAFRGTRELGDSCTTDALLSAGWDGHGRAGLLSLGQCADGGVCENGRCVAGETAEAVGDPCSLSRGRACEPGTYCSVNGVCTPLVEPGGTCDAPHSCASDLPSGGVEYYCDGIALGKSGSGVCAPVTAVGGECVTADYEPCGYGNVCPSSGRCQDDWPLVCEALRFGPAAYNPFEWIPE